MSNKKKRIKKFTLSFIIIFIVSYCLCFSFSNETNIYWAREIQDGISNSLNKVEEGSEAWSYRISEPMHLKKGNYDLNIKCYAEANTPISLKLTSYNDFETGTYPVIELGVLEAGNNEIDVSVYIPRDTYMAILYADYQGYGKLEFKEFTIVNTDGEIFLNKQITAAVLAAVIAAFASAIIVTVKENYKKALTIFVLAIIVALSSVILFEYNSLSGDDGYFHVSRIWGIADNIMRGSPFSKINFAMTAGYGYMDPVFYPNSLLYIPAILVCMGASAVCAFRLFIFLINIATTLISYYSFGKIAKNNVYGLLCAAIYTLNHYRMRNCYVRAALGEVLFMAFLPIVMYAIYEIFHKHTEKWIILAIGATLILQSHILGTVLTAMGGSMMILGYFIINILNKENVIKPIIAMLKAGIATILFNVWFLVPMLYYYRQDFILFKIPLPHKYINNTDTISGILFDTGKIVYETPYTRLGLVAGIIFIIYIILVITGSVKGKNRKEHIMFLTITLVFFAMSTRYLPWERLIQYPIVERFLSTIQFGFRMIGMFVAFEVIGLAVVLEDIKLDKLQIVAVSMMGIVLISGIFYETMEKSRIDTYQGEFWHFGIPLEYNMNGQRSGETTDKIKFATSSENIVPVGYEYIAYGSKVTIENNGNEDGYIEIPMYYYDGYSAYSESTDEYLPIEFGEEGVIKILLTPETTGDIFVQYKSKYIFHVAEFISVISVLTYSLFSFRKYNKLLPKNHGR